MFHQKKMPVIKNIKPEQFVLNIRLSLPQKYYINLIL